MNLNKITITKTGQNDLKDIFEVEQKAFGQDDEAVLSLNLLKDNTAEPVVSLLAYYDNKAVGHVLFTRLYANNKKEQPLTHLLAPLAVIPEFQNQGIGKLLVKQGYKELQKLGCQVVFVLGHFDYYPKVGFIPDAASFGYEAPYPIPEGCANAWMVKALTQEGLNIEKGKMLCADALNKPEYWRE